jgi:acetyl-CoA carboxylase biotin carboxyl carrier protein
MPVKFDSESIRELAELLNETNLTEIEITEGKNTIRVNRQVNQTVAAQAPVAAPAASHVPANQPPAQTPSGDQANTTVSEDPADHPGAVTSPMVGTVYLQPDPESPPFVTPGDTVSAGDTLMIVEAMKVMNPIKAPQSGKVSKILANDEQPVEFGEPLAIIEQAS